MSTASTVSLAIHGGPRTITEPLPDGALARTLIDEREVEAVGEVIRSGRLFRFADPKNSHCTHFEHDAAAYLGVRHALLVNSGTMALVNCCIGLGLGPGDEVIVPAYTYIATPAAVVAAGAVPVIVDIDESLGLDPEAVEAAITPSTRAIIAVHMQGVPCRIGKLASLAKRKGLLLIEDCCQAIGARHFGRVCGSFGQAGAWSLNYYKNITCGEGGLSFTDDDVVYERMAFNSEPALPMWMRDLPEGEPPWLSEPFSNHGLRFNEILAAMIRVQFERLEPALARTRAVKAALLADLSRQPRRYRVQHVDDPSGDCGISFALICHDAAGAQRFAEALGAEGLGTGTAHRVGLPDRHIFRYWDSILNRRSAHAGLNPWTHPAYKGHVSYPEDLCTRSLALLDRTLRFALNVNMEPCHGALMAAAINKVDAGLD
jgi:dTDP-4-amino-4,6-dideoxygalactose transaminase